MHLVIERSDGGVTVFRDFPDDLDAEEHVAKWQQSYNDATVVSFEKMTTVPVDREFRNAWFLGSGAIEVDLAKARDIQAGRIEAARLSAARDMLDRETLGEDVTAEKARLRAIDARAAVNAAPDIAALKAAWPAGLDRLT